MYLAAAAHGAVRTGQRRDAAAVADSPVTGNVEKAVPLATSSL